MAKKSTGGKKSKTRVGDGDAFGRARRRGREVYTQSHAVVRDAQALLANVRGAAQDTHQTLSDLIEAHPYRTLSIAMGAGVVLGGGISLKLSRVLLSYGARMALSAALNQVTSTILHA